MKSEHKEMMKARRRNIKLTLSYDGTNYHGFQRQTKVVAVQNVLEGALFKLFGDSIELAAAGRTDAGVHAIGQVVNFFTDGTIPIQNVVRAGNRLLPDDIVLLKAEEADRDFSALHSVKSKIYIYKVFENELADPFMSRFYWHVNKKLNLEDMQEALKYIEGEHDFLHFVLLAEMIQALFVKSMKLVVQKKIMYILLNFGAVDFYIIWLEISWV